MLQRNKKSQSAMEFLITYGWALGAVLLVIGALTYYGTTRTTTHLPKQCTFNNGFICNGIAVNNIKAKLNVQNDVGAPIFGLTSKITAMTGLNGAQTIACYVQNTSVAPGDSTDIVCQMNNATFADSRKISMTLTYTKGAEGVYTQTSTGTIFAPVVSYNISSNCGDGVCETFDNNEILSCSSDCLTP